MPLKEPLDLEPVRQLPDGPVGSFQRAEPISLRQAPIGRSPPGPRERQRVDRNRSVGTCRVFGACDVYADRLRVKLPLFHRLEQRRPS